MQVLYSVDARAPSLALVGDVSSIGRSPLTLPLPLGLAWFVIERGATLDPTAKKYRRQAHVSQRAQIPSTNLGAPQELSPPHPPPTPAGKTTSQPD